MSLSATTLGKLSTYFGDESGATAIEYGLIVAIIAIGAIVGFQTLSDAIQGEFTEIAGTFESATATAIAECTADGSC